MAIDANTLVPMKPLKAPGKTGLLDDAMLSDTMAEPISEPIATGLAETKPPPVTNPNAGLTKPAVLDFTEAPAPDFVGNDMEAPIATSRAAQSAFANTTEAQTAALGTAVDIPGTPDARTGGEPAPTEYQPQGIIDGAEPIMEATTAAPMFTNRQFSAPTAAPEATATTTAAPTSGGAYEVASMVDRVVGTTPETIEGEAYTPVEAPEAEQVTATGYESTGYEAQQAPEAVGYEAKGYEAEGYQALQGVAKTTAENVSDAIQRITGQDSPIMQRAVAQATAEANRRGLLNSSMAAGAAQGAILDRAFQIAQSDVQNEQFNVAQQNAMESQNVQMGNEALRFTADARNAASSFLANAQNRSAEFLAAERNQNGRFNAEQANRAAEFTANAQNQASQFAAAAQNQASIFNAGEANRLSMFSAEQANQASRFAAEMQQAASQFNATAFNQAQQRYADAMNAALAAETDATNQSRRDLAAFTQQAEQNALDRENRLAATQISAGASVAAAGISAQASMANAAAQRDFQAGQNALEREFRTQENEATRQFNQQQMGVQAYNTFATQVGQIMQNTNLTDEGRRNAVNTLISLHNGHPYGQVNINLGG